MGATAAARRRQRRALAGRARRQSAAEREYVVGVGGGERRASDEPQGTPGRGDDGASAGGAKSRRPWFGTKVSIRSSPAVSASPSQDDEEDEKRAKQTFQLQLSTVKLGGDPCCQTTRDARNCFRIVSATHTGWSW